MIVAEYALLEAFMLMVYAVISKLEPEVSAAKFYNLRSAHLKEELVISCSDGLTLDQKKAMKKLWRRFKSAANRRTEIAHCLFFDHGHGPMRMRVKNENVIFEPLTDALVERTFNQFHILGTDLLTFAVIVGGPTDHAAKILKRLPLSPRYKNYAGWKDSQDPPSQDETNELLASLERLGLKM